MKYLWIIDEESSVSIFHRNFTQEGINPDPDLFSGLLSALNYFSEIQLQNKQGIESIEMGGLSYVYLIVHDYNLLFIAADNKSTDHNTTKSRLEVIRDIFIKEFDLTPQIWLNKFHGETSKFDNFSKTADILVSQWREAERTMNTAETFDLLGFFQQIFNICINLLKENKKHVIYMKVSERLVKVIKSKEYEEEQEIYFLKFNYDSGWEIINIDPSKISQLTLEKFLLHMTNEIKISLIEYLGVKVIIVYIFPFLLSNWSLIRKLNIDREILNIFLNPKMC